MGADNLLGRVADLVLGARCAGCGRPGLGPCDACASIVTGVRPFVVPLLPQGLPPVLAGGAYADELRRLLLAAKERGALGLLPLLAARVAATVAEWALAEGSDEPVVLVPVPSARAHVSERGVDLPAVLSTGAARKLRSAGLSTRVWRGLRLVGRPLDQSELGRQGRLANLVGAMAIRAPVPAGRLVVVDDIVTTGATLGEAVRALRVAGRPAVAAATVAATTRWQR